LLFVTLTGFPMFLFLFFTITFSPVVHAWRLCRTFTGRKMENGIVVFRDEAEQNYESFSYEELVDMKVNALDLLASPKSYKVDKVARQRVMKK